MLRQHGLTVLTEKETVGRTDFVKQQSTDMKNDMPYNVYIYI